MASTCLRSLSHSLPPSPHTSCLSVQVKSVASVPVIANGDVFCLSSLSSIHALTGVDGFMSARGILANPAVFTSPVLPASTAPAYLRLAEAYGGRYSLHHHHLSFMLGTSLTRAERMEFSAIRSLPGLRDWFEERGLMRHTHTEAEADDAVQAKQSMGEARGDVNSSASVCISSAYNRLKYFYQSLSHPLSPSSSRGAAVTSFFFG